MTLGLHHWPDPGRAPQPEVAAPRAIVFVHGIFSSHDSFRRMHQNFYEDTRFKDFELFYYDYDFNEALAKNGARLADALASRFGSSDFLIIVAHSMGGLVSRLALLSRPLDFVQCLFLLGTPNVGAMRTAQLALLADALRATLHTVVALFPRKRGIMDLTNAAQVLDGYRTRPYARDIDYVTIPGLYFHEARSWLERGRNFSTRVFGAMRVALSTLGAFIPLTAINLSVPHDGIVEEASNNLIPSTAGRISEKNDSINFPDRAPPTYAHVELESCQYLTHTELQADRQVFEAISSFVLFGISCGPRGHRLRPWNKALAADKKAGVIRVRFHE